MKKYVARGKIGATKNCDFGAKCGPPQVKVDVTEMAALRSLTKKDMLIVTKPLLLRGFDYKSDAADGINLLMMSSVSSERALLQALGRVGRYQ